MPQGLEHITRVSAFSKVAVKKINSDKRQATEEEEEEEEEEV